MSERLSKETIEELVREAQIRKVNHFGINEHGKVKIGLVSALYLIAMNAYQRGLLVAAGEMPPVEDFSEHDLMSVPLADLMKHPLSETKEGV